MVKRKQKVSQTEWDRIFKRVYMSGKFQFTDDIVEWMRKKFEIKWESQLATEIFDQGLKELKCPDMPIRRKRRWKINMDIIYLKKKRKP